MERRNAERKDNAMFDAMNNSKEQSKFMILQTFVNSLNQCVDFIIKVDNPFLSFSSKRDYSELMKMGLQVGRLDLQKKGMSLLKKYLFVDFDKYLLQYENDKMMAKNYI